MSDTRILEAIKEHRMNPDYIPENGKVVIAIGFSDLVVGDGVTPLKDLNVFHIPTENGSLLDVYNQSQLNSIVGGLMTDIENNLKKKGLL